MTVVEGGALCCGARMRMAATHSVTATAAETAHTHTQHNSDSLVAASAAVILPARPSSTSITLLPHSSLHTSTSAATTTTHTATQRTTALPPLVCAEGM